MIRDLERRLKGRKLVLWGTGDDAKTLFPILVNRGFSIDFFVSKNYKHQKKFYEYNVYSKIKLIKNSHYVIIATSNFACEITCELIELGFTAIEDFSTWNEIEMSSYPICGLEKVWGRYHSVYSLGYNCSNAMNMIFYGLRLFSGPFDWIITRQMEQLLHGFDNGFETFFIPANMKRSNDESEFSPHCLYVDHKSEFMSVHDIPKLTNDISLSLAELKKKFDRRALRFIQSIRSSSHNLFIRRTPNSIVDVDAIVLLKSKLDSFSNENVLLVISEYNIELPILRDLGNNTYVYLCPYTQKNDFNWLGNICSLYPLFSNIFIDGANELKRLKLFADIIIKHLKGRIPLIYGINEYFPIIEAVIVNEIGNNYSIYVNSKDTMGVCRESMLFNKEEVTKDYYLIFPNKSLINGQMEVIDRLQLQENFDFITSDIIPIKKLQKIYPY